MEFQEAKNLIAEAQNIYLIPEEESCPESLTSALSLFYTLKELGKNVNIVAENFPDYLKFLTPSLDFVSYPKNFVISVPSSVADISQIYYEKNDQALKIHLSVEKGIIKKDDISFYFSEAKPDLIITLGIKDYQQKLETKLNPLGFLLDAPILNIDASPDNKNFGRCNLVGSQGPITELVIKLAKEAGWEIKQKSADCLLSGFVIYTDNFRNYVTPEIFEEAARLMKKGANLGQISNNICEQK